MQLAEMYPNTSTMFGQGGQQSPLGMMYGQNQYDQASQAAQQNFSQAQQDQSIQAQRAPDELALIQAQARNQNALGANTEAELPSTQAAAGIAQINLKAQQGVDPEQRRQAAITAVANQISDNQLKALSDRAQIAQQSDDPATKAWGDQHWAEISAIKEKKMELASAYGSAANVANIQGRNELALDSQQAGEGKYFKNSEAGIRLSASVKGLSLEQQIGVYNNAALSAKRSADDAQDQNTRQQYMEEAQQYAALSDRAAQQKAQIASSGAQVGAAGKADLNSFGVNTVVPPSSVQPNMPTNPLAGDSPRAPTDTGTVLMRDKSGLLHTVPKANVGKAQSQGWSLNNAPSNPIPTQ